MESKHETPSIILRLMGLDEVRPQYRVRNTQKVLSEKYHQKVASIGVRKKRPSRQYDYFRMSIGEKEESVDALEVVKTGREKGMRQMLLDDDDDASYLSDNGKPETSADAISSFNSWRMDEQGGNGLNYSSFHSSCKNSHSNNGVLIKRVYPEMKNRKRTSYHMDFRKESSKSFSKVSEKVSTQTDDVANKVLDVRKFRSLPYDSSSFFRRNEASANSFNTLKPATNVSFNEIQCNSPFFYANGSNGSRNFSYRSGFSNDNHGTVTNDNLFQKYWGLRKNASVNYTTLKSKYQNITSNHREENCIGLHKLKKRCYGNDLSDQKPMLPQLSRSEPSPTFSDIPILHETCSLSKQNSTSPNLLVDCSVSDAKIEILGRSHIHPSKQQTESKQKDTSEFQDSASSFYSRTEPDSHGSFEEECEPSPVSVLDVAFREDISLSSECLKLVGDGGNDSSEVDDEGFDLTVSSDVDCGDKPVGDFIGKKDSAGLFTAEESSDISYVVDVLTEAGISNRGLFTHFSTCHSAECPISPSIFEIVERKFGEQKLWKRSERRLLFDRINLALLESLESCSYIPTWKKTVTKRLNPEPREDMIEEICALLVAQEKEASKDSADKMVDGEITWTELREEILVIVKEIVKLLIDELAKEMVSSENL